jgi:hypothetical protein
MALAACDKAKMLRNKGPEERSLFRPKPSHAASYGDDSPPFRPICDPAFTPDLTFMRAS